MATSAGEAKPAPAELSTAQEAKATTLVAAAMPNTPRHAVAAAASTRARGRRLPR
jgi:hypothetical protein